MGQATSVVADAVSQSFLSQAISNFEKHGVGERERNLSFTVTSRKLEHVASETHTEIIPEHSSAGLVFVLNYDDQALQRPERLLRDLSFLSAMDAVNSSLPSHKASSIRRSKEVVGSYRASGLDQDHFGFSRCGL